MGKSGGGTLAGYKALETKKVKHVEKKPYLSAPPFPDLRGSAIDKAAYFKGHNAGHILGR